MKYLSGDESGQALLLVLLSMAVVLTIVLSILSRSVTDIGVASKGEESVRAFSAAEAGVEQALVAGSTGTVPIGDATFNASVTGYPLAGANNFNIPSDLFSGDSTLVWFVSHNADGKLTCTGNPCFTGKTIQFCWGENITYSDPSKIPALEASFFYDSTPGDSSTIKIARVALDPNSSRRSLNHFSPIDTGTCQIGGQTYAFKDTVDVSTLGILPGVYTAVNGLQFARLRILYNTDIAQPIAVNTGFTGGSNLPSQGMQIDSVGTSGSSVGTSGMSTRKVEVLQGFPEPPLVFDAAVFGLGGISQ